MVNPTYIPKPAPTSTPESASSVSDFGAQAIDGNQNLIQSIGSGVVFQDAAGTKSPLAASSDFVKLEIPTNAKELELLGDDFVIANDAQGDGGSCASTSLVVVECTRQGEIYIKANKAVNFIFTII